MVYPPWRSTFVPASTNKNHSRNSVVPNGHYLRQLRAKLGLTQIELAFRLDLSERLVRKAEKSERIDSRSLVLFRLFFEQQGLAVDPEQVARIPRDAPKSMAISFFDTCLTRGELHLIDQHCHEQVSAEIDGRVAVGHVNVKALLVKFESCTSKAMQWARGTVVSESNNTSIFWSRTFESQSLSPQSHTKSIHQRGVVLIRGSEQVESFELFIFK